MMEEFYFARVVEAKTDEICKEHVDAVVDVIRSKGYEVQ